MGLFEWRGRRRHLLERIDRLNLTDDLGQYMSLDQFYTWFVVQVPSLLINDITPKPYLIGPKDEKIPLLAFDEIRDRIILETPYKVYAIPITRIREPGYAANRLIFYVEISPRGAGSVN